MATKTARLLNKSQSVSKNSAMARLLAKSDAKVQSFSKRDIVKGKITKLTRGEILVDLGSKAEAVVLEKDSKILRTLLDTLKVGDEVTVSILSPESESGYPVVSLRRFVEDRAWEDLAKIQSTREKVNVEILEITKGGYVVRMDNGIQGFLPQSHIMRSQSQDVGAGDIISVFVQDLKRQDGKIIFSQKQTLLPDEFRAVTAKYKKDQKIEALIENVTPFGIFVSLPFEGKNGRVSGVDGLIHISEISWDKVENISGEFNPGEKIEALVVGFDADAKRVDLSIKRLSEDPFSKIAEKYPVDKKVSGKVLKVVDGNLQIGLEDPSTGSGQVVEALVRKEKVPPNKTYSVGESVELTVSSVDAKRRKIELTPVLKAKPIGYR